MTLHLEIEHLLSLAAGILILVQPKFLNYIVAFYLVVRGVIGIAGV